MSQQSYELQGGVDLQDCLQLVKPSNVKSLNAKSLL